MCRFSPGRPESIATGVTILCSLDAELDRGVVMRVSEHLGFLAVVVRQLPRDPDSFPCGDALLTDLRLQRDDLRCLATIHLRRPAMPILYLVRLAAGALDSLAAALHHVPDLDGIELGATGSDGPRLEHLLRTHLPSLACVSLLRALSTVIPECSGQLR